MHGRVDEADDDREPVHGLEDALEVLPLEGQDGFQGVHVLLDSRVSVGLLLKLLDLLREICVIGVCLQPALQICDPPKQGGDLV